MKTSLLPHGHDTVVRGQGWAVGKRGGQIHERRLLCPSEATSISMGKDTPGQDICDWFFFSLCFLQPHLQHIEVPRLGIELELQVPAYTPAQGHTGSSTH